MASDATVQPAAQRGWCRHEVCETCAVPPRPRAGTTAQPADHGVPTGTQASAEPSTHAAPQERRRHGGSRPHPRAARQQLPASGSPQPRAAPAQHPNFTGPRPGVACTRHAACGVPWGPWGCWGIQWRWAPGRLFYGALWAAIGGTPRTVRSTPRASRRHLRRCRRTPWRATRGTPRTVRGTPRASPSVAPCIPGQPGTSLAQAATEARHASPEASFGS